VAARRGQSSSTADGPLESLPPDALEALTRGFAHESRNPLFALSANADLLGDRLADAASQELITSIRTEVRRVGHCLDALVEFGATKIDQPAWHAPRALIERALADAALPRSGPRLTVTCARRLDQVHLAGDAFERVMFHLLSALAPRWPAEAMVTLRLATRRNAGGDWLALTIGDHGRDAPRSSELRGLFVPYGARRLGLGGLGLATAARIARRHGARIRPVRGRQRGLQFRVDWPLSGIEEEH
jgi:K+-sensing histidine kinase KdpD